MKPKRFSKKLTLNKTTVADLGNQMDQAYGGAPFSKNRCTPDSCFKMLTCTCTDVYPTCPGETCFLCV